MKKLITVFAFVCLALGLPLHLHAQNLTTVSGSNITDINGVKLAAGQLCFLITDQQDNPISVSIGGGGQALKRGYCSAIAAGVVTSFTVPNPASTQPSGIYYRITVKDSSTGLEVLRYTTVSFTGATFNFDNYAPQNLGSPAPLSGNAVTGNLSVTGNVAATGTVTATNIPGSIPGAGACTNQFVTALNTASAPTCSNSIAGVFAITGSANLGTAGTSGQTAGGFTTPSVIRHYCGDGTGWRCEFAKRAASIDTIEAWITDGGVLNVATGYQLNGGAPSGNVLRGNGTNFVAAQLAAADLSNGVTGSGAVVLAASPAISNPATTGTDSGTETLANKTLTSPVLNTPAIGSAGGTFAGSTSGTTTLKASATASGTLTLPAATGTIALGIPSKQIFTTSGTFTIPAGVTAVKVTVTGGGGAGAGGSGASGSNGSGGGAGGTAIKWLTGLTPGNTLTVTVGSGGTGVSNAAGNSGTPSTVASGTQTITTLTGGAGNGAPNAVQPGIPGGATNGDINLSGGIGTGQAGGSTTVGGNGAASYWGGGGGFGVGAAGGVAVNPGAGGGGAGGGSGSAVTGGAGAAGIVLFEWVQ
jgi:hypothetical protein